MKKILLLFVLCSIGTQSLACTIFSGKDKNGQVWAANNEDNAFSFSNYINIFPKTEDTKYGYYTVSYFSERNGENFNISGGMNEAGLFYDFNTIPQTVIKDIEKKQIFPAGSQKILSHLLANLETVQEVVDFFEVYWFEIGFNSAQMHVTDKYGNFAIIGPSGSRILKDQRYQVSTNFDICGQEDGAACWRYPIAIETLKNSEIGQEAFREICQKTSQKGKDGNYTIYSNIQNLNTGEIWFYFLSDYQHPFKTTLAELLAKGRKSYLIKDLFKNHPITVLENDFLVNGGTSAYQKFKTLKLSKDREKEIASIFVTHILAKNYNMEALPFLEDYLQFEPVGWWMRATRAITYFQKGDQKKAIEIIKDYKEKIPETSMPVDKILNQFNGIFADDTNVTIELNGFQNATHVFVKGLPVDLDFLIQKNGKWMRKFKLKPGVYNYSFVVDGQEVFDPKTPVKVLLSSFETPPLKTHQLCIEMSNEVYSTTIKVRVPNENDVVYIAGNQNNLTNWNSIFRLTKVAPYEREITVDLHFPAKFKFTKGDWTTEAVMEDGIKTEDGWLPIELDLESGEASYKIISWKE